VKLEERVGAVLERNGALQVAEDVSVMGVAAQERGCQGPEDKA